MSGGGLVQVGRAGAACSGVTHPCCASRGALPWQQTCRWVRVCNGLERESIISPMRRSALLVLFATPLYAVKLPTPTGASPLYAHVLRLQPGDDLVDALLDHCQAHTISAATIVSCIGSLSNVGLRMAGAEEINTYVEELEVISLAGTLCADRKHHLHCAVSRRDGSVIGGHLKGAAVVRTTAEVVIGLMPQIEFSREHDEATGYLELQIGRTPQS